MKQNVLQYVLSVVKQNVRDNVVGKIIPGVLYSGNKFPEGKRPLDAQLGVK